MGAARRDGSTRHPAGGPTESRGARAGCQATVPEGFLAVRGAGRDFVPMGLSRTDVLVTVIFRSEALRWDIYNDSKKRALFCLKLMWNPIAMCLFLFRGLGFFLNYISAKDARPAAELDGTASVLRNANCPRGLNIGFVFGFFFLFFQREFVLLLVRLEE